MVQGGTDERDRPDPRRTLIEEPDRDKPEREEPLDPVEEADEESFPASDPPPGPGAIG